MSIHLGEGYKNVSKPKIQKWYGVNTSNSD